MDGWRVPTRLKLRMMYKRRRRRRNKNSRKRGGCVHISLPPTSFIYLYG
jgi:hypothetical protein